MRKYSKTCIIIWCVMHILGEFGIVYKGYLTGQPTDEVVAIKTLKGTPAII